MQKPLLLKSVLILSLVIMSFGFLYFAKAVLMPLAIAGVLAILFMPISAWIERKGLNKGASAFICCLIFVLMIVGVFKLLSWQFSNITTDLSDISKNISVAVLRFQAYISDSFGISATRQNEIISKQNPEGGLNKIAAGLMTTGVSIVLDMVLILAYLLFLLYFRGHFKSFILKLVPKEEQTKAEKVISQSSHIVQRYLSGLAIIIVMLWIMYGIGFSIIGIKGALFFAILCGMLEIFPFVGNITGSSLTVLMAFSQGGGITMALEVVVTYAIIQGIQFYILSPFILGTEVNINPLFIIIVLICGEVTWGIPGMILAIPCLGIAKIVFDNIDGLKPYGYLIGQENKKKGALLQKLKHWLRFDREINKSKVETLK